MSGGSIDPNCMDDDEQLFPRKDPHSKKTSGQYDYSLHSVPVKTTHQIRKASQGTRKHSHHRHHRTKRHRSDKDKILKKDVNPTDTVKCILGDTEGSGHEPHQLFSELEELCKTENGMEWKETARWVKFEEDVEEGANRWSKPHVSSLSMHSLMELRSFLVNGTVFLDLEAENLNNIMDVLLESMVNNNQLTYEKIALIKSIILRKHRHQFEGIQRTKSHSALSGIAMLATSIALPRIKSLADIGQQPATAPDWTSQPRTDEDLENDAKNVLFLKKLPKDAEASNILVGEVDFLEEPFSAFIRLQNSTQLGDLTEVSVPTRFLFILLGPESAVQSYHEIGRSMAGSLADEVFHQVAYKAKTREQIVAGLDEFLDQVTVLPPGEWDRNIRIEPPVSIPSQESRKQLLQLPSQENRKKSLQHNSETSLEEKIDEEEEKYNIRKEAGLVRTGKLFGGLMDDIRRKKPWYMDDFKDALSVQSLASTIFIYFACLAPIVAFGGLLGDATENRMASIEALVSGLVAGVIFGFCSGQPLTILGLTGPDLVFETMVYDFCKGLEWDYLSFRVWIGLWVFLILLVLVATDASAFVCYITRFTEESFATLIAVIFIIKAIEKVVNVANQFPIYPSDCFCQPINHIPEWTANASANYRLGLGNDLELETSFNDSNTDAKFKNICSFSMMVNGSLSSVAGQEAPGCHFVPNAFIMSLLLFFGTYLIAMYLKRFKNERFFPTIVRSYISDFAVIIAILLMVVVDILFAIETPKLEVPREFKPTWSGRGWVIPPFNGNPWYTSLLAVIPAILGSILIFMDQQITAVIVNRKEHLLKKGGGYHLDLLIVGICIVINSIFGIPWYVASTILSINHVRSLEKESECSAPGEKVKFLGIREQRVTHVIIFILVGLSAFMAPLLSKIPMPVLYGVFLYMGINSLDGLQMFDRLLLFFMPKKYQPDHPYLRQVPTHRVHLFTAIQVGCFIILWLIQSFKQTSILFPIMLVLLIGIRKLLDQVFTNFELKVLDDVLPQSKRQERLDQEEIRRKSVDCGNMEENNSVDDKNSDDEVRFRKNGGGIDGPFVHFYDENDERKSEFPVGDFDDDGAIHIKPKMKTENLTPDILKIA